MSTSIACGENMIARPLVSAAAALALIIVGCGDSTPAACVAGRTVPCACPGGDIGAQSCNATGGYAACVCGSVSMDAGALDLATAEDAAAAPDMPDAGASADLGPWWEGYDAGLEGCAADVVGPAVLAGSCGAFTRTCLEGCTSIECVNDCFGIDRPCEQCFGASRVACARANGCDSLFEQAECCFDQRCADPKSETSCTDPSVCLDPMNAFLECLNALNYTACERATDVCFPAETP